MTEFIGEIVGTLIYTDQNLDPPILKKFLSKYLADYKIPVIYKLINKPLPRIASEKLDRVEIKKILSKCRDE